MYFFDKKIEYLIWEMQEGAARGVGTVRFLAMDQVCRIEIVITNCGKVQGTYPVYLICGELKSLIGEISMKGGKGNLYIKGNTEQLGHAKLPYIKITGIYVDLGIEGALCQRWLPHDLAASDNSEQYKIQQEEKLKKTENMEEETKEKRNTGVLDSDLVQIEQKKIKIYSNKWQQLCAIYPIVHPFKDGRGYLSIEPRDFVVLQEKYHSMAENSFLLHGYHHYHYLLLGRQREHHGVQYYLGVPGVFYEKEKAAALFYGFESFEGPSTPIKEGDFGYYMKRVQI